LQPAFADVDFEICEIGVLSKFGKSVDRRQYLATEATRPSGESTVTTDGRREVWLFFALKWAQFDKLLACRLLTN
jgi:hypothetical protein